MTQRTARLAAFFGGSTLIVGLVFGPLTGVVGGKTDLGRVGELTTLNLKFDGAGACGSNQCHGATKPYWEVTGGGPRAGKPGNENITWRQKDPHSAAFDTLKNKESAAIGKQMGIADVTKSEQCLSCHSTHVPANLQGKDFKLAEGNTCTACHGPSEKWLDPHAKAGWTDQQRQAMDHTALLKTWGLYDTKPAVARAEICTSCHLAIDPQMVAAGHPQPSFELDFYSTYENFPLDNPKFERHWQEASDNPFHSAQLWAAGQVVSLRDALKQLALRTAADSKADAAQIEDARKQAMAHLAMSQHVAAAMGDAKSLQALAGQLGGAGGDKAKLNAAATTGAAAATALVDKVRGLKADAAFAKKALAAVAGDTNVVTTAGKHGAQQQALALYGLYNNVATAEKVADAKRDEAIGAIGALFPYADKAAAEPDAAAYNKDLAAAKAKVQ